MCVVIHTSRRRSGCCNKYAKKRRNGGKQPSRPLGVQPNTSQPHQTTQHLQHTALCSHLVVSQTVQHWCHSPHDTPMYTLSVSSASPTPLHKPSHHSDHQQSRPSIISPHSQHNTVTKHATRTPSQLQPHFTSQQHVSIQAQQTVATSQPSIMYNIHTLTLLNTQEISGDEKEKERERKEGRQGNSKGVTCCGWSS